MFSCPPRTPPLRYMVNSLEHLTISGPYLATRLVTKRCSQNEFQMTSKADPAAYA